MNEKKNLLPNRTKPNRLTLVCCTLQSYGNIHARNDAVQLFNNK